MKVPINAIHPSEIQHRQFKDKNKFEELVRSISEIGLIEPIILRKNGKSNDYEIIADEIVRTLVGSIGLILAVPITTFLAAYYFNKK